jgi:hypothetical protein
VLSGYDMKYRMCVLEMEKLSHWMKMIFYSGGIEYRTSCSRRLSCTTYGFGMFFGWQGLKGK